MRSSSARRASSRRCARRSSSRGTGPCAGRVEHIAAYDVDDDRGARRPAHRPRGHHVRLRLDRTPRHLPRPRRTRGLRHQGRLRPPVPGRRRDDHRRRRHRAGLRRRPRATTSASASATPTARSPACTTYAIDYTVEGALTGFPDHDELFWDAIGNQWTVPIDARDGRRRRCPRRSPRSRASRARRAHTSRATRRRRPGNTAHVRPDEPVEQPRRHGRRRACRPARSSPARARSSRSSANARRRVRACAPTRSLPAGGLACSAIGGVLLLLLAQGPRPPLPRVGRRPGDGQHHRRRRADAARAPADGTGRVRPARRRAARPGRRARRREREPARRHRDDRRPRGARLPHDHRAPAEGFLHRRHDYELTRSTVDPPTAAKLLPYEQQILDGAVQERSDGEALRSQVQVPRRALRRSSNAMYDDAVQQGWYRTRPDRTRASGVASASASSSSPRRGITCVVAAVDELRPRAARGRARRARARSSSPTACRRAPARAARCCRGSAGSAACSTKATRTSGRASPSSTTSSRSTCRTRSCSAAPRSGRSAFEGLDADAARARRLVRRPRGAERGRSRERARPLRHGRDRHAVREPAVVIEFERLQQRRRFSGGGGGGGGGGSW